MDIDEDEEGVSTKKVKAFQEEKKALKEGRKRRRRRVEGERRLRIAM